MKLKILGIYLTIYLYIYLSIHLTNNKYLSIIPTGNNTNSNSITSTPITLSSTPVTPPYNITPGRTVTSSKANNRGITPTTPNGRNKVTSASGKTKKRIATLPSSNVTTMANTNNVIIKLEQDKIQREEEEKLEQLQKDEDERLAKIRKEEELLLESIRIEDERIRLANEAKIKKEEEDKLELKGIEDEKLRLADIENKRIEEEKQRLLNIEIKRKQRIEDDKKQALEEEAKAAADKAKFEEGN
jgi:hypothetical protein